MTEKIRIELDDATDAGAASLEGGLQGIDKAAARTEQQLNQTADAAQKIGDADVSITPTVDTAAMSDLESAADSVTEAMDRAAKSAQKIGDADVADVVPEIIRIQTSLDGLATSAHDAVSLIEDASLATEELGETGEATEASLNDVVASIDKLTDKIVQETEVIQQQTKSWAEFGVESVSAIASVTKNVIDMAVEIGKLSIEAKAYQKINAAVKQSQELVNVAQANGINIAARVAGAVAGYGEAVSGVLVALAAVKGAQIAYNTVLENTGKSADGLTNNLTRTREANSQLWDDIKATASAGAESVSEWGAETVANAMRAVDELTGVSEAWKEVDRSVTESTNNYVRNTQVIGEAIRGVSREAVAASKSIAKAQAESIDDFDRVRMSNEEIAQAAKNRAEAERIASLDTVEAINSELKAMQQLRGEMAAANQFGEEDQKRYVAAVGQLEERRTQITKRNAEERERILKQEADQRAKSDADYHRRVEDERNRSNNQILDAYREQVRKENDERRAREREIERFIERERTKILQEEQQKIEAARRAADERLSILKQEREQRVAMVQNAQGDDGKNMLDTARQQLDPRKVREEYVRKKQEEARANWTSPDDNAAAAGARRNAAAKQAGIQAFRDFNAGRADQADVAGAQNSLIQTAAKQAQGRGQLDQQTADALIQATQNQQNIVATQERQAQQLRQIQQALAGVGNASRNMNAQARRVGL